MSDQESDSSSGARPGAAGEPAAGPPLTPAPGPRRRSRFHWLRWSLLSVLLLLVCIFGYAGTTVYRTSIRIYHATTPIPFETATREAADHPALATPAPGEPTWTPGPTETPDPAESLPPGRTNILVLGTDKRAELGNEAARSDTLIVVSVDPQWKTGGILSIPRDLQVNLPPYGLQKINAAYFYGEYNHLPGGGPVMAVTTVSRFFNVPIPYYVTVNFDGFEKIVDEVGGIDLYVPEAIDDPEYPGPYNSTIHVSFAAGCQHMDGARALEYARTRHADSDFGRARRQQQVIKAVRDKATGLNMIPRYGALLEQLGNSVETNIPPDKQLAFAQLASQMGATDVYTAQIDSTMVTVADATGALVLRRDRAKPMLDWFFGRGRFLNTRPGVVLTAAPTVSPADAIGKGSLPVPTDPALVPTAALVTPSTLPSPTSDPSAPAGNAVPTGKCR